MLRMSCWHVHVTWTKSFGHLVAGVLFDALRGCLSSPMLLIVLYMLFSCAMMPIQSSG